MLIIFDTPLFKSTVNFLFWIFVFGFIQLLKYTKTVTLKSAFEKQTIEHENWAWNIWIKLLMNNFQPIHSLKIDIKVTTNVAGMSK